MTNKSIGIIQVDGFSWTNTDKNSKDSSMFFYPIKYTQYSIDGQTVTVVPYWSSNPINQDAELSIRDSTVIIQDIYGQQSKFVLAFITDIRLIPLQRKIPHYITDFVAKVNKYKGISEWKMDTPTWFPAFAKYHIFNEKEREIINS